MNGSSSSSRPKVAMRHDCLPLLPMDHDMLEIQLLGAELLSEMYPGLMLRLSCEVERRFKTLTNDRGKLGPFLFKPIRNQRQAMHLPLTRQRAPPPPASVPPQLLAPLVLHTFLLERAASACATTNLLLYQASRAFRFQKEFGRIGDL